VCAYTHFYAFSSLPPSLPPSGMSPPGTASHPAVSLPGNILTQQKKDDCKVRLPPSLLPSLLPSLPPSFPSSIRPSLPPSLPRWPFNSS